MQNGQPCHEPAAQPINQPAFDGNGSNTGVITGVIVAKYRLNNAHYYNQLGKVLQPEESIESLLTQSVAQYIANLMPSSPREEFQWAIESETSQKDQANEIMLEQLKLFINYYNNKAVSHESSLGGLFAPVAKMFIKPERIDGTLHTQLKANVAQDLHDAINDNPEITILQLAITFYVSLQKNKLTSERFFDCSDRNLVRPILFSILRYVIQEKAHIDAFIAQQNENTGAAPSITAVTGSMFGTADGKKAGGTYALPAPGQRK